MNSPRRISLILNNGLKPPTFVSSNLTLNYKVQELFALFMRDFILSWYYPLISENSEFLLILQDVIGNLSRSLDSRLKKIDWIDVIMSEVPELLSSHLQKYRETVLFISKDHPSLEKGSLEYEKLIAQHFSKLESHPGAGVSDPTLSVLEDEKLVILLRKMALIVLSFYLPRRESNCAIVKEISTDVVAYGVFGTLASTFSDPNTIYSLLLSEHPKVQRPGRSWISLLTRGFNPISLIKSTFRSVFNFFLPSKVKLYFREIHWLNFLDILLHWSERNPIFTESLLYVIRPIVYFFFGEAIQKYIKDYIEWIISSERIVFYIDLLKEVVWPNGVFINVKPLSHEEKLKDIARQREEIIRLTNEAVPDWLTKFIPRKDINNSLDEVLDMLNHKVLNRVLLLQLLDVLLARILPELKEQKTTLQRCCESEEERVIFGLSKEEYNPLLNASSKVKIIPGRIYPKVQRSHGKRAQFNGNISCPRHPTLLLSIEEDTLLCNKCFQSYCSLLCASFITCTNCNLKICDCQCGSLRRGSLICEECKKRS